MGKDGAHLFMFCGSIFSTTADDNVDMSRVGSLEGVPTPGSSEELQRVVALQHSSAAVSVAVVVRDYFGWSKAPGRLTKTSVELWSSDDAVLGFLDAAGRRNLRVAARPSLRFES